MKAAFRDSAERLQRGMMIRRATTVDDPNTALQQQVLLHTSLIDNAHAQLRQHTIELGDLTSGMRASHDRIDRRVSQVETKLSDDHLLLIDLRASVAATGIEVREVGKSINDMARLLATHAADESVQMSNHTDRIEKLARRLIWVAAIGTIIVFAAARLIPPESLSAIKALVGG